MSSRVRTVWIKDGRNPVHNGNVFRKVAAFVYDLQGVMSIERMQRVEEQKNRGFISNREALHQAVEIARAATQTPQYLVVFREQRGRSWRRSKLKKIYDAIGKKSKKFARAAPNRNLRNIFGEADAPLQEHGQPEEPDRGHVWAANVPVPQVVRNEGLAGGGAQVVTAEELRAQQLRGRQLEAQQELELIRDYEE